MLFCISHVRISLGKPNISSTGSLVGSKTPGISIDRMRVRFRFTSIDSDASRVGVYCTSVGTRFTSVGGKFALVGIRFARVGANASRISSLLTSVGRDASRVGV